VAAVDLIDAYVSALPGDTRRLAQTEWGITVRPEQAGGWPLEVGLRLSDGLLRAQAFAVAADRAPSPALLLHWNRQTRFVRFATTRSGDVWVHGDLAAGDVREQALDRLLGLLVQGAVAARAQAEPATG
jgi:hypothetical protein